MGTNGPAAPERHLSVIDAICIVVGIVVGSLIFFFAPFWAAKNTASAGTFVFAWVLGGFFCLCGALSYAELATAYPNVGGEYYYLRRSMGSGLGFLFVWARSTVIQTGSIAMLAYVVGKNLASLCPLTTPADPAKSLDPMIYALGATVVLTTINVLGWKAGKWTQNVLTAVKVVGVLAIIAAGLLAAKPAEAAEATASEPGWFGYAMVLVLYAYGGWNEAAYVAGEVRNPRRNMLWVLMASIAVITLLYVAVNLAYLRALGYEGLRQDAGVSARAMLRAFGPRGATFITLLVVLSALGACNGTIFTGARAVYAFGNDHAAFRVLGRWSARLGSPAPALLAQGAITALLVLLPNLSPWLREKMGSDLQPMVDYTLPTFWSFLLLTGIAFFLLRAKDREVERPFRVPLFPIPVVLFCLMCGYMLYSSLAYTKAGALVGVGVLLIGVPAYALCGRRGPSASAQAGTERPE